jgi:hypothetical protein
MSGGEAAGANDWIPAFAGMTGRGRRAGDGGRRVAWVSRAAAQPDISGDRCQVSGIRCQGSGVRDQGSEDSPATGCGQYDTPGARVCWERGASAPQRRWRHSPGHCGAEAPRSQVHAPGRRTGGDKLPGRWFCPAWAWAQNRRKTVGRESAAPYQWSFSRRNAPHDSRAVEDDERRLRRRRERPAEGAALFRPTYQGSGISNSCGREAPGN